MLKGVVKIKKISWIVISLCSCAITILYWIIGMVELHDHLDVYKSILMALILITLGINITSVFKTKGDLKWAALSVVGFNLLLLVIGVGWTIGLDQDKLNPWLFFPAYYTALVVALYFYIKSIRLLKSYYKLFPICMLLISIIPTLYVILINGLWGKSTI
jgi:phosphoglycerol transferase MdoB-like AlkP superfamily enzyme